MSKLDDEIEELLKIPMVGGEIQDLADGIKKLMLKQKLRDAKAYKKHYSQLLTKAVLKELQGLLDGERRPGEYYDDTVLDNLKYRIAELRSQDAEG